MPGLTGIYWDEKGTEVKVTEENKDKWYDYDNKKWANVVSKDGSYWVWIPRFEYKIDNSVSNEYTSTIKFIKTSQTTPDEDYQYVHPSFRDGRNNHYMNGEWDKEIPGFWVSKYDAEFQNISESAVYSNKNYSIKYTSNYFYGNSINQYMRQDNLISYPVFIPNKYAYNMISFRDAFTISKEIANGTTFYGFNPGSIDSHMTKNSEYAAVLYLTLSSKGANTSKLITNNKNYNQPGSNQYSMTGYGGNNLGDASASTTYNKTGVFDLAGGIYKYMSSYISNGNSLESNDMFSNVANPNGYKTLSNKYVTVYPYNSSSDTEKYNYEYYKSLRINSYGYGDAIQEITTYTGHNFDSIAVGYMESNRSCLGRSTGYGTGGYTSTIFNYLSLIQDNPDSSTGFRAVLIGK